MVVASAFISRKRAAVGSPSPGVKLGVEAERASPAGCSRGGGPPPPPSPRLADLTPGMRSDETGCERAGDRHRAVRSRGPGRIRVDAYPIVL